MRHFLKRWGMKAVIPVVCWLLGVGMTDLSYHIKQAVLDTNQDGRLTAVEQAQRLHLEEARLRIIEQQKQTRILYGLLVWLRVVANREGWPPPPEPSSFRPESTKPGPWWIGETRADTLCAEEGCP